MKRRKIVASVGYAALAASVVFSCFAPDKILDARATEISMAGYRSVELAGVARDFHRAHPDFQVVPTQGKGQYAGMVEVHLGLDDRPTLARAARLVTAPARDFAGREIAPHLADGRLANPLDGVNVLLILGSREDPEPSDLARAEALRYWGHDVTLADETITDEELATAIEQNDVIYVSERAPWVAWVDRLTDVPVGIVMENPRLAMSALHLSFATGCTEATAIELTDTRHEITRGFEEGTLEIFTAPVLMHRTYGGVADGAQELARIGDTIKPALLVVETGAALRERVAAPARRVRLPWGVIQPDGSATRGGNRDRNCQEFMMNRADDAAGTDFSRLNKNGLTILQRSIAWASMGNPRGLIGGGRRVGDVRATVAAKTSTGGVHTDATFREWFANASGVNLGTPVALTLFEQPDGLWVFDDRANTPYHARGGFYPVDGAHFGSEGGAANNHHFTVEATGVARYAADRDLYIKVTSTCEVWVFVDGRLAIDLGGIHGELEQRIDLDRFSLSEGQLFSLDVFVAQRNEGPSRLRLETNAMVIGSGAMAASLIRPDPPHHDTMPFERAAEADVNLSVASAEGY